MIGMMYLVLTAMLALNVSREVVNAFILVDEGLVTTTENFAVKNAGMYSEFAKQYELNKDKVGDWKDKADEVRKRCDELYDFIYECKAEILKEREEAAIDSVNKAVIWEEVHGRDNMDYSSEVMIARKRGEELKGKIEELREYMLSLIDDKDTYAKTVEALEEILSTDLPKVELEKGNQKKNQTPTWDRAYFDMMPLASVITLLSKMQADVRNAEAEMLEFLLGQIGAGDIPINAVEAVVVADRSLVFPGQEYKAKIILAAYDSTKAPVVELNDGTEIPVEGGKGIYTITSNQQGIKTWGGTITLENNGQITERKFQATYEVGAANATVSATRMNVFFRGIPNPVGITAGGVAESSVQARITSPHSIKRIRPGMYEVRPGAKGDKAVISVYSQDNGTSTLMGRQEFRVEDLPDPVAKITGSKAGQANLSAGALSRLDIVEAEVERFYFEVDFKVTEFVVVALGSGGISGRYPSTSEKFTAEQKDIFRRLRIGQTFTIRDIKAIGPDGKVRQLNPIIVNVI